MITNGTSILERKIFSLPNAAHAYWLEIINRCESLIQLGIWSGINVNKFRMWLNNFKTEQEKYFAACILDSFIYRSDEQTISIIKQLFQRTIPDLTKAEKSPIGTIDIMKSMNKNARLTEPGLRLVTVLNEDDPPTKSSYWIARFIKRNFDINPKWIIEPKNVKKNFQQGIRTFIFIDDILATGHQFELCIDDFCLGEIIENAFVAYTPLIAHKIGIDYLKNNIKNLKISTVEMLDNYHSIFHADSPCFADGENTPEAAKQFYFKLLKKKNIVISGSNRRGYGHLELAFAFEQSTPDNSLPILWWSDSILWQPLLNR